ncbi:hypothetical protein [Streptomyces sp. NPDC059491]|uniref:hypothetical protein n=1 Tax=Streptomyces sp. NPDC059491 TaxID=3346850 RepID=UPI003675775E
MTPIPGPRPQPRPALATTALPGVVDDGGLYIPPSEVVPLLPAHRLWATLLRVPGFLETQPVDTHGRKAQARGISITDSVVETLTARQDADRDKGLSSEEFPADLRRA